MYCTCSTGDGICPNKIFGFCFCSHKGLEEDGKGDRGEEGWTDGWSNGKSSIRKLNQTAQQIDEV